MKDTIAITPHTEEDKFENELAHFIDFVEKEAQRKYEENTLGVNRRDGGTNICCAIYLKAFIMRIKNDTHSAILNGYIIPVEFKGDPYVSIPDDAERLFIIKGGLMFKLDLKNGSI